MRGLSFALLGALAGGVLAVVLGIIFGSGVVGDFVLFEFGIYAVGGMIVGGGIGCLVHVATKGSGRYEGLQPKPVAPAERKPVDKGTAVMTTLIGGLGMSGFIGFKMMNAPPGMEPVFIGALVGSLAGTVITTMFIMRKRTE